MTDHHRDDDLGEWAALYASGALPSDEMESRLAGDAFDGAALSGALKDLYPVVELLVDGVTPVPPPVCIRETLLRRVDADMAASAKPAVSPQVWRDWPTSAAGDELFVLRAGEGRWEETGVAGVRVRRLFVDRRRNQMTAMVRMEPKTSYPGHRHAEAEECLVLEGDLWVGDTVLHAGDYQRAPADSMHGVQRTEGGCLLLITSSLTDEMS